MYRPFGYFMVTLKDAEPEYGSGIALGYGLDDRRFESRQGLGIFLFTTASILLSNGYQGLFPGAKAVGE
jgi:hypothetical protein